ncbi:MULTISPECIES: TetR/AcrR family transcriptional regulator [unclassified Arthrobacter]|uniref:TetR/AcrR family transcriptional regulator n=1 Tax=unclassified Arthrobacter TaxID=235627 RepID=UPI00159E19E3|nr:MULTISPECIES: TetR family transcriptional regulator C-terminal domain-containing protein [unclassified Arthrobacter]MCQ9165938.1 TetR family transcriptional regulator C-terminal domain-containing protein [Arthrobacter sp. STN4]NVN00744.1 TetR/AcrR family transcriptional regulator [Arthrobacter sp. SDTb3-6]
MPKIVDADDRRELVADAVFEVINRQGLAQASLRTVAEQAGLALGSVRHYFANQAELMEFAFRVNSERVHMRALDRLEDLEGFALPRDASTLVEKCAVVLEALLPLDAHAGAEAVVRIEFMLAARTDGGLQDAARDDYRATGAVVGRVVMQLLESGLVAGNPEPVDEAERLIAVLDGLGLRMVLQPGWSGPEQGSATLRRHLHSLLAA